MRPPTILVLLLAADIIVITHTFSTGGTTERSVGSIDMNERPLLRKFKERISKRVRHSKEGRRTSEDTMPCLDMQCTYNNAYKGDISSRREIRNAFTDSSSRILSTDDDINLENETRQSSGGCTIIRLTGTDAASIRGLTQYSHKFFDLVDDDDCNDDIIGQGVFRIDNHVYAGFDDNVNGEGKMQFLDTRILPSKQYDIDPLLLPMEVGELVGKQSLSDAHHGMDVLLDIGTQITSAVLDMDSQSADKLIDDGTHVQQSMDTQQGESIDAMVKEDISNSYHRLIRYLKPQQSDNGAAFQPHYDSSFLTLIPMPKQAGLEVWCPSRAYVKGSNKESQRSRGDWIRPAKPVDKEENDINDSAYVIALAGVFLQLTSNGEVPVCIHRVIPPLPPNETVLDNQSGKAKKYTPRVSAPMFLRPRRGNDALLDVSEDLTLVEGQLNQQPSSSTTNSGIIPNGEYFEDGLLEECDGMHLWSAH